MVDAYVGTLDNRIQEVLYSLGNTKLMINLLPVAPGVRSLQKIQTPVMIQEPSASNNRVQPELTKTFS